MFINKKQKGIGWYSKVEEKDKNEKTEKSIPYSQIRKAKLDFSWEEA